MVMLTYLVKSKARRRLLLLLWGEARHAAGMPQRGSVTELADAVGISFGSAHKELAEMKRLQLVTAAQVDGKEVFAANHAHPHAAVLRALVATPHAPAVAATSRADEALLQALRRLGAPLAEAGAVKPKAVAGKPGPQPQPLLPLLARSLELARRRPDVAKALPVLFSRHSHEFTHVGLRALKLAADKKHALGFLLELAGEVAGDQRLATLAEALVDHRVHRLQPFFIGAVSRRAAKPGFALAKKWGFSMELDAAAFRDLYRKVARP